MNKTTIITMFLIIEVVAGIIAAQSSLINGRQLPTNNTNGSSTTTTSPNGSTVVNPPEPLGDTHYQTMIASNLIIGSDGSSNIYINFPIGTKKIDPTISKEQQIKLIDKFRPTMVLHSTDITEAKNWVEPKDVSIFTRNNEVQLYHIYSNALGQGYISKGDITKTPEVYKLFSEQSMYPFGLLSSFFDWSGRNPGEWQQAYDRVCKNYKPKVYATYFELEDYYALQYYYFTPYNDFVNEHEGDWENVTVYVKKSESEKIYSIEYMFHHYYIRIRNTPENAHLIDIVNNHPIIYSGGEANVYNGYGSGSHGLFPYPAKYYNVEYWSGVDEHVDGKGKIIYWNQFDIDYVLDDYGSNDFYYPAYWGNPADNTYSDKTFVNGLVETINGSPKSPYTRNVSQRWKRTAYYFEEDKCYPEGWPSRENTSALERISKHPNGNKGAIQSILSLLLGD
jgi:hypothetical protein